MTLKQMTRNLKYFSLYFIISKQARLNTFVTEEFPTRQIYLDSHLSEPPLLQYQIDNNSLPYYKIRNLIIFKVLV